MRVALRSTLTSIPKVDLELIYDELKTEVTDYYEDRWLKNMTDYGVSESDEDSPLPPPELQMLWMVERFGVLPNAGGLLDQPNFLMSCFNVCVNGRDEIGFIRENILKNRAEQDAAKR